jgi:hypothetical protein
MTEFDDNFWNDDGGNNEDAGGGLTQRVEQRMAATTRNRHLTNDMSSWNIGDNICCSIWKFFNAIVSPDDDSPARILDELPLL